MESGASPAGESNLEWMEKQRQNRPQGLGKNNAPSLRSLLEDIRESFVLADAITDSSGTVVDFLFVEINEQTSRLVGLPRADLLGKRGSEAFGPLNGLFMETMARVILTGEAEVLEQYSSRLDKWLEVGLYPFGSGQLATITRDITVRKQSEALINEQGFELENSHQKYRLLFEEMQEAVVVLEPCFDAAGRVEDVRFLSINPAAEKLLATSSELVLGKLRSESCGPMKPDRHEYYNRVVDAAGASVCEETYFANSERWAEVRTSYRKGKIFSIGFDITERKVADKKQQEALQWLFFLNEASARLWKMTGMEEGLKEILSTSIRLMKADKGNIQLLDPQKPVLQIVAQQGFGSGFLEHFREVSADSDSVCGRAFRDRKQLSFTQLQDNPGFSAHHHVFREEGIRAVQSTPLFNQQALPVGMISTHTEADEKFNPDSLRRLELYARFAEVFLERVSYMQLISRANRQLEAEVRDRTLELTQLLDREKKLNESKSRFVSYASHEFRTPLSTVLSSISLIDLHARGEIGDKIGKHIERVKSSVNNMIGILNDFLSLDKLEQGKTMVHLQSFDLIAFARQVSEEVVGLLKPGQHINFLGPDAQIIHTDKSILRNILLNLLSNAIKYSPAGKPIGFSIEEGEGLTIRVRDEGIGIPVDEQSNLFEKYFRAGNATNVPGTGLGLNIVKRYVELLHGEIGFTSFPNSGTEFTLHLPGQAVAASAAKANQE